MKSISIDIFYRPPTQNDFLETLLSEFEKIDFNRNEVYLLGDFNINLLCGTKYALKEKNSFESSNTLGPLVNLYKGFCQTFSITQLIKTPTRLTYDTSSLLGHILSSSIQNVANSGVIDIEISNHLLIYNCTRKIYRQKLNSHNQVQLQNFKIIHLKS